MIPETTMARKARETRRKSGDTGLIISPPDLPKTDELALARVQTGRQDAATLHTLQRLSREITSSLNIREVYEAIYRGVRELMDCDAFFITLFDSKSEILNYVFRVDQGIIVPPTSLPLGDGMASYVVRTRQTVCVADATLETRFKITHWGGWGSSVSLICVPMLLAERVIGALSAQSYRRDAYDEAKVELLNTFAAQAAIAIQNAQFFAESQRKIKQFSVLNEVARIVSSTIEIDQLLELIYDQVKRVLPTDTYYVTLTDFERQVQTVEVLVDDGERFPPLEISLGEGISSLVVRRRAPIMLKKISEEGSRLGVQLMGLGKPRRSESWLGVPMMTSEHFVGVLAVASYQPAAFDDGDMELLQNIALQAAIAVDNARHHAEVENQARRDSLTQVFNHGYIIECLQKEIDHARQSGSYLSLIMLDIDHFKDYNDRYGHLAGDAILRSTVQAILHNIKRTDSVGRWGGEEFAIVLPGVDAKIAHIVAERIRTTLAQSKIEDDQGREVPVPTVSQGIAAFPRDANQAFALVDAADVSLYRAKALGRDEIGMPE